MTEQARRPVMLVILDGWGWREENKDNAVRLAHTPNFDRLWGNGPHAFLTTCGEDVGLPEGQFGQFRGRSSQYRRRPRRYAGSAAHHSRGARRFSRRPAAAPRACRRRQGGHRAGPSHGLISPGGVHSHQDHAVALARILTEAGPTVLIHAFTDGRDTPPRSGRGFLAQFEAALPSGAHIATVSGRYYAMDRDNRWERVSRAYNAIVSADAPRLPSADAAIAAAYADGQGDEFVAPAVVGDYAGVRDGDALLCFNFRADRTRQLMNALLDPGFNDFERGRRPDFSAAAGSPSTAPRSTLS